MRHFTHALQHFRQRGARDGAVHAEIVGRDAADRRECGLAPGPEQQPLRFRVGAMQRGGAAAQGEFGHLGDEVVDLGKGTVELDDQDRFHIERIAGMNEFLHSVDGRPVHHLDARGNDPGRDDAATQAPASPASGKPMRIARALSGFWRMRTVTSVTTPSSPSEPMNTPSRS